MNTTLPSFLNDQGFRQVSLSRSGVGHFHAAGSLGGRPVAILIDTGAASTVVGLALARELGLELKKLQMTGGGAGGANLELHQVVGARLSLGDVEPRLDTLIAMDLTHVNQSLALKGEAPVDVILGADVLQGHAAVIDYGSSSLFLKFPKYA
jgi:clan AA aspartic protease (TIGR02281 family)